MTTLNTSVFSKFNATIFAVLFALAAMTPPARGAGVTVKKDLLITKAGGVEIKGDLYLPAGKGPFPGLLSIHGGGFITGSKNEKAMPLLMNFFAENGYIVFNVDYRLLNQGGVFPNCIQDVKCAMCWLKAEGPKFGLDPARTGVIGFSAGGYLAGMVGLTAGNKSLAAVCPYATSCNDAAVAAAAVYPATDFTRFNHGVGLLLQREIMSQAKLSLPEAKALFDKYSLVHFVQGAVPLLLIHGKDDRIVPVDQSRLLYQKLKDAGKPVDYLELPSAPHGFIITPFNAPAAIQARQHTLTFFNQALKK